MAEILSRSGYHDFHKVRSDLFRIIDAVPDLSHVWANRFSQATVTFAAGFLAWLPDFINTIMLRSIESADSRGGTRGNVAFDVVTNEAYSGLIGRLDDAHRYEVSGGGLSDNDRGNVMEVTGGGPVDDGRGAGGPEGIGCPGRLPRSGDGFPFTDDGVAILGDVHVRSTGGRPE